MKKQKEGGGIFMSSKKMARAIALLLAGLMIFGFAAQIISALA